MICQRPVSKARALLCEFVGGNKVEKDEYAFCPSDEEILKEIQKRNLY